MGATKKYFKNQFQIQKFKFEYEDVSDFYLGCFQRSTSCIPLLLMRTLLFFGSVAIVVAALVMNVERGRGGYWPIYLTNWGIFTMMICTGFAFIISLVASIKGSLGTEVSFRLPWYVTVYWVLYNAAISMAVFVTIFYWAFLSGARYSDENQDSEFAPNKVLDIFIHAVNSVVMLLLLLTSRQPVYILHFYIAIIVPLVYMIFSVIYWAAGGLSPRGNPYIYAMLDWSRPGVALIAVALSAALLIVVHILISLLALGRDALAKLYRKDKSFTFSQ
ncbi:unnamed protein product [Leptosia nina]|uniref:Protein rolling stone-like n=1 Tax=Leptosia nina TaxID=320188 RepID=A0AAV1IVR6_9NEOP